MTFGHRHRYAIRYSRLKKKNFNTIEVMILKAWLFVEKRVVWQHFRENLYRKFNQFIQTFFSVCECMTFWYQTWKSFEFNLLSLGEQKTWASSKFAWLPFQTAHTTRKKKNYKRFNSNFFYSCVCPFFTAHLQNFHILRYSDVWLVCFFTFYSTASIHFFAFCVPILPFDFYTFFSVLENNFACSFNSICELRLNYISLC